MPPPATPPRQPAAALAAGQPTAPTPLQPNCWDACKPPPAVSAEVMDVLKLWRNICLIASAVTCGEAPGVQPPSG
ncbi:pre-mRNA-splicing factor 38B [Chlorella sorokiniana]|uniref:Pre-mRNA-splicing factor 38B n=1 Tax=Chlorella sorokiniana TaxID=3076 RepID=A0A2P6U565_CHLSO|nr:pre-mRNA-splicing factor 38B [Chlorella sorokiniana]|eukprot:PRW61463.1 pre-mRNA-splicing factor 38B [Chlorella sorokiniana]